jgi:tryptophan-rich sensory protein
LLGEFVPGSSESTEWLWRGTNANATGGSLTRDGQTMLSVAPADFQARVGAASEAERIDIYREAAFDYVAQHPADAARLYVLKLKAFWWGSDTTGLTYPPLWTVVYDGWYAAVLVCSAFGVWSAYRDPRARPAAVLIVASLVLISMSQAIFYVEGRHRLAVEPLLLVLAGIGLTCAAAFVRVPRVAPSGSIEPGRT